MRTTSKKRQTMNTIMPFENTVQNGFRWPSITGLAPREILPDKLMIAIVESSHRTFQHPYGAQS